MTIDKAYFSQAKGDALDTYGYDALHNDPKSDRAIWHTGGSSGNVPVLILAYSLGATRAFCLTHIDQLISGNYGAVWLPVSVLTIT